MQNNRTFYNEIVLEHANYPAHKYSMEAPDCALRGVNPTCGDDITLELKISPDGVIEDGSFVGDGCAISRASADMMLDLIIGKTKAEALQLKDTFLKMIKDRQHLSDGELDQLEEAASLQDVSHMPSRVKCAVLAWHTLEEALTGDGKKESVSTE